MKGEDCLIGYDSFQWQPRYREVPGQTHCFACPSKQPAGEDVPTVADTAPAVSTILFHQ